ncbi:MAG: hypothetical protein JWM28_4328 [Chitinophagaceae bacterium]|nr:hypothetical protein [Chitinophagaceae bacterium]
MQRFLLKKGSISTFLNVLFYLFRNEPLLQKAIRQA